MLFRLNFKMGNNKYIDNKINQKEDSMNQLNYKRDSNRVRESARSFKNRLINTL